MNRWLLACLLVLSLSATALAAPAADFDQTLRTHLQAITDRDLPTLLDTVSERADFSVIFPNGQRLVGKAAFEAMHTEWFADPDWRMSFEEISRWQSDAMAGVLLRYDYRDQPEPGSGNRRQRFLFLLFQLIDGQWLLVHDQNTPIAPPQ